MSRITYNLWPIGGAVTTCQYAEKGVQTEVNMCTKKQKTDNLVHYGLQMTLIQFYATDILLSVSSIYN